MTTLSPPRTPHRLRPDNRRATSDGSLFINTSNTYPHDSPRFQHTQLPHSPLAASSPHAHSPSPQYRAASPRLPFTLDGELARRHAPSTPTASPRRAQFGGSPVRRSTSPALSRDGTERGMRQRSRTEPTSTSPSPYGVAGEQYGVGAMPELRGERERERERQRAHGEGHARKSSAYAALAALSGLGVGHPSSARHPHTRNGSYSQTQHPPLVTNANTSGSGNGPPTPGSTPPLSADVRDETTSESEGGEDEEDDSENGHGRGPRRKRRGNGKLLTPPATPPRGSLLVVAGSGSADDVSACEPGCLHAHPHEGETRPAFNARKASAQCRQLEGYVSFAAVEGLGEPPSPGPEGDLDDEDASGKRKRGSLGAGIVGFWKTGFW